LVHIPGIAALPVPAVPVVPVRTLTVDGVGDGVPASAMVSQFS